MLASYEVCCIVAYTLQSDWVCFDTYTGIVAVRDLRWYYMMIRVSAGDVRYLGVCIRSPRVSSGLDIN